ncbi:hypothetical protein SAMN05216275_15311 [Streptosporangium canum]|uniref:Uncharacterized protein n=1 Tax=Streptosporangium canum TaxID=324952 RepID=A0A1I4ETF1_9ACTN|nr:hypothetical protein SAMN05216275_15311 [Streptosporangium canum]
MARGEVRQRSSSASCMRCHSSVALRPMTVRHSRGSEHSHACRTRQYGRHRTSQRGARACISLATSMAPGSYRGCIEHFTKVDGEATARAIAAAFSWTTSVTPGIAPFSLPAAARSASKPSFSEPASAAYVRSTAGTSGLNSLPGGGATKVSIIMGSLASWFELAMGNGAGQSHDWSAGGRASGTEGSPHDQQPRPNRVQLFPPPSRDGLLAQVVRSGQNHPVGAGHEKDVQQAGEGRVVRRCGPSIGEDAAKLQFVLLAVLGEGYRQGGVPLGRRTMQPQVPVDDRAVHIVLFGECPQGSRPYRGRGLRPAL